MIPLLPCFKVLPLVYDESLSYYEVLCKLTYLIKEMSENVDGNFDTIQKEIEKIYGQITDLKKYIDEQDKKLSDRIDLTNERISEEIKKCHEHCEAYAKRLYDQLLDILNQYQGEMKQWVLGEIAKIPTGIPKQFAITGNPETSGLQHDIITVTRESMCDFVDSNKLNAYYIDECGIPISFYENTNTCYDFDTKLFTSLSHNPVTDIKDFPESFCFEIRSVLYDSNEKIKIITDYDNLSIYLKENFIVFEYINNDDGVVFEKLEMPISNIYVKLNIHGSIMLVDTYKGNFVKLNFFNNDVHSLSSDIKAIDFNIPITYSDKEKIIYPFYYDIF